MSRFTFYGNVCAVNQQVGDNNRMTISEQDIEGFPSTQTQQEEKKINEFSKGILSSVISSAIWEVIKILL